MLMLLKKINVLINIRNNNNRGAFQKFYNKDNWLFTEPVLRLNEPIHLNESHYPTDGAHELFKWYHVFYLPQTWNQHSRIFSCSQTARLQWTWEWMKMVNPTVNHQQTRTGKHWTGTSGAGRGRRSLAFR